MTPLRRSPVRSFVLALVPAAGLAAAAAWLAPSDLAAQEARLLRTGDQVEREIRPGSTHAYRLELEAGRFVAVALDQRGADVETRVLGPDGELLDRFDGPGGAWGPDPVVFTTDSDGTYRLEVRRRDGRDGDGGAGSAAGSSADDGRRSGASYALRVVRVEPVARTPLARVSQLVEAWDRPRLPGYGVAVVQGGEVVFSRGLGLAALEHGLPITAETVFDVGSVSKEFTDFALVLLALEGRLSLDDDIRVHLPEVPDFGRRIRVRDLAHHTSGLREIYSAHSMAGRQDGDAMVQEDALRLVRGMRELNFDPGSEYLYSNTGYMLLADLVSRVTGEPFARWMEGNVFGPLGMRSTTIMAELGQVIPGAAHSYAPDGDGGWRHVFDNSSIQGAGGVYSTLGDLARWIGNLGDPRVGGPGAVEQMLERGILTSGDTLDYALGLRVGEERGLRTVGHTGSSAGFRTVLTWYPEADAGVVVLHNGSSMDGRLAREVAAAYLGDRMEPAPPPSMADGEDPDAEDATGDAPRGWSPSAAELESYAGVYYSPELETVYTLVVEDGALEGRHWRHGGFSLRPGDAPGTFRAPGFLGTVRFEVGEGSTVDGFRASNGRVRNLRFQRWEGGGG